jgi:hypothetical protein
MTPSKKSPAPKRAAVKKKAAPRAKAKALKAPALSAPPSAPTGPLAEALDRAAFYGALAFTTLLLVFVYSLHIPEPPTTITIITGWLAPESGERRLYELALLAYPLSFLAIRGLAAAFADRLDPLRFTVWSQRVNAVVLLVSASKIFKLSSHFNFWYASSPMYWDVYFKETWLRDQLGPFALAVAALSAAWYLPGLRAKNPLADRPLDALFRWIIDGVILFFALKLCLFGIDNFNNWVHWEAVYFAMIQVFYGHRTLLVDYTNQYGLYPHFLHPIFKLWGGLSEWRMRICFSALMLVSWLALWGFLRLALRNRALAFVSWLAVVHYTYLIRIEFWDNDPYYQYFPIRFITPTLAIYLSAVWFKEGKAWAYRLAHWVTGLGLLWNLESGVIAFFAWNLSLLWWELAQPGGAPGLLDRAKERSALLLKHAGMAASVAAAAAGGYSVFCVLRAGSLPHFLDFLTYQNLFYKQGFGMIAMTLWHPWLYLAAVFAAGLAVLSGYLFRGGRSREGAVEHAYYLMPSLIGSGFFSYFQGRSHDTNILLGLYAPVLVTALLADRALARPAFERQLEEKDWGRPAVAAILLAILLSPLGYALGWLKKIDLREGFKTKVFKEAPERYAFLKGAFKPGEQIYVMRNDQANIHSGSQTGCDFAGPSRVETILESDQDDLKKYLMEEKPGRKLVALGDLPDDFMNHTGAKLNPHYQVDQAFQDQYEDIYVQMPDESVTATVFDLREQLFHVKEHRQFIYTLVDAKGKPGPNFDFRSKQVIGAGPAMSLELAALVPASPGGNLLVSNRSAETGFDLGPASADSMLFRWGASPEHALSIPVKPGALNYIAIECGGGMTRAYVDGKLVGSAAGTPKASGSQVLVHEKWHPWNGRILELKIGSRPKSAGELAATAAKAAKLEVQP